MLSRSIFAFVLLGGMALCFTSCSSKYDERPMGQYNLVIQKGGATLGYSPQSCVQWRAQHGSRFKDSSRAGKLDK